MVYSISSIAIEPIQSFLTMKSVNLGILYYCLLFLFNKPKLVPSLEILVVLLTEVPGLIINILKLFTN